MKKLVIIMSLSILPFIAQPSFSEDLSNINMDQALLQSQLQQKLQNASPEEISKANSDPDVVALMQVMKLVQNKSYKESIPILEKLMKSPEGKGITPQAKTMIKNLIEVMKSMDSGDLNEFLKN